jgi:uncharacterized membrane protein
MDIFVKLILWVHLLSLVLAGCATFAAPAVRRMMMKADAGQRPVYVPILAKLSALGRMALVLLILSGLTLIWAKYGGFSGQNGWFHVKMTLVALVALTAIFGVFNARKAQAGDAAAIARMPTLSKVGSVLVIATVFAAAFAFN